MNASYLMALSFLVIFIGVFLLAMTAGSKKHLLLKQILIFIFILCGMLGIWSLVLSKTVVTLNTTNEAVAMNAHNRPIYDVIDNNDNDDWVSGSEAKTTYKIYLKSGRVKTVEPDIVHIDRSKTTHLKVKHMQSMYKYFGINVTGNKFDEYTLYVADR